MIAKWTFSLLLSLFVSAAWAADRSASHASTRPQTKDSVAASARSGSDDSSARLRVQPRRQRVRWEWESEDDWGPSGELLVGSGVSFETSPNFAVGGTYATAVGRRALTLQELDPERYTVFMRWRF